MGLVEEVLGHRCPERGNRRHQLRDLPEHVAGVQAPCLPNDPLGGRGSRVDFSHAQVSGCLDGGALCTCAAVAVQAQPNGFRRIPLGFARTAEVPVGAGSVTEVAAFVEVQPFRLRPISDEGQGFCRIAQGLLAMSGITGRRVRAGLHGCEHGDRARGRHLPGDVARRLSKLDCLL